MWLILELLLSLNMQSSRWENQISLASRRRPIQAFDRKTGNFSPVLFLNFLLFQQQLIGIYCSWTFCCVAHKMEAGTNSTSIICKNKDTLCNQIKH